MAKPDSSLTTFATHACEVQHISSSKHTLSFSDEEAQGPLRPLPKARLVGAKPSPCQDIEMHTRSKGTISPPRSPTASSRKHDDDVTVEEVNATIERTRARHKLNSQIQFLALCWLAFLIGWNDGTLGPLIPRLQSEYNLNHLIVSLLFVASCVGYMSGAVANIWLTDAYGLGKVAVIGSAVQIAGYIIVAPSPPFGVMCFAHIPIGFGSAILAAQGNGYLGCLKEHMATKLGFFHGAYGLGAFVSPFVSTVFSMKDRWSFHFLISAGLQLTNLAILVLVFRFRKLDDVLADAGQEPSPDTAASPTGDTNKFKALLKMPSVHALAAFALIYVGVEVTLGGWIVTFIIEERNGGPDSGYISSGFFGGLALGRVVLIWFNKRVGEERIIYIYSLLAIGLELTIWFVPSIIQNAIAVSIIGMLLGPMFPIIVSHCSRILPRWILTACIGWISGVGVSGSASVPFLTGLLASKVGIKALQPLMVSMISLMAIVWLCVPKVNRRID